MTEETLVLIEPDISFREEFARFWNSFPDPRHIHGAGCMKLDEFDATVQRCHDFARGRNMSEGKVPSTTLWLVRDGTAIIGTTSIRHELNELLLREGGHIGYSIKPDERGKGYGTEILRLGLLHARNVGLTKVLITCNKENVASARVIQRNGGVLENEVEGKHFIDGIVQRYWIELA